MLISLRNNDGKLIVKDYQDLDFDMSIEKEEDKFFVKINSQYKVDVVFQNEKDAEECMRTIVNVRNKLEEDLLQYLTQLVPDTIKFSILSKSVSEKIG